MTIDQEKHVSLEEQIFSLFFFLDRVSYCGTWCWQFYHGWKVFENEAGRESLLRVLPRLHPPVLSVIIRIS